MSKPILREDLEHVLQHTRELWETIRGRRIFVTGCTGFFGCWLLETFAFANDQLSLDAHLVGLTRDPEAFRRKAPHLAGHAAIHLWKGDVRDFDFPAGEFSCVIHAGTASSTTVAPLEMIDTILAGTRRALDFAVVSGAKKFLFASSGAVYGGQPPEMERIPETYTGAPDPADPDSAYGEGKRLAELLCAIYRREHGIETKIARCFAFVGPHLPLNGQFAIGNFIRDALIGGPIRVKGDGTPFRSYLYAADLAIWLWTILFRGEAGCARNVGSGNALTIEELARTVSLCCAPVLKVSIEKKAPDAPAARYVPDVSQAGSALKLFVRVPLKDAIQRTLQWHKDSGENIP